MDDLLREAIADAKAVRETALENAKIALEEAFTPRLQSMLSKKIAAEAEDAEEQDHEEEEMREQDAEESDHEEEEMREVDHEESEVEEEETEESEMEEEEAEESEVEEQDAEEMDAEEQEAEESEHEEMREEEDAEEEDSVEESEDAEENEMEEDELDLESVLAELEKDLDDEDQVDEEYEENEVEDGMSQDEVDVDEEDHLAENDVPSDIGKGDNKVNAKANDSSATGAQGPEGEGSDKKAGTELGDHEVVKEEEDAEESDLDLDEVLRALTEEEAEEQDAEENEKLKAEIKEHRKVIHFMRSKLNEVNLLNAKLLFSNKLFRAFGLNNNQKLKVVETFDRTKNLREVKLVYATLAESFKRPSNRISESVKKGSASKPVRSTKPKAVLSEGQELKARFKKLANIL